MPFVSTTVDEEIFGPTMTHRPSLVIVVVAAAAAAAVVVGSDAVEHRSQLWQKDS
jgi:hypothetical protein